MISRRGEDTDTRTGWVPLVVFALIIMLSLIAVWRFDLLGKLDLLPSYNQTVTPNTNGSIILAFDFATNEVSYYSGSAFIALREGSTLLLGKEFDSASLRREFQSHYLGRGAYSESRAGLSNYTALDGGQGYFFKGINSVPYLGAFIISPDGALRADPDLSLGFFSVFGYIGNYRSLHNARINTINPGAVPVLYGVEAQSANNDAATRVYGAFIFTQSNELYIALLPAKRDLTFNDVKPTVQWNYKKYSVEDHSSLQALESTLLAWRDSIYVGGSAPLMISIPYKDAQSGQSLSQTVPVERDGTKVFVRLS